MGSLERDSDELGDLVDFLKERRGASNIAIIGHSTGCQNAVHFLAHATPPRREMVRAAVLQVPNL